MVRVAALLGLLVPLLVYDAVAGDLPRISWRWDIALLAVVILPMTFALVWFALPYRRLLERHLGGALMDPRIL